jgi:hypothetical protein
MKTSQNSLILEFSHRCIAHLCLLRKLGFAYHHIMQTLRTLYSCPHGSKMRPASMGYRKVSCSSSEAQSSSLRPTSSREYSTRALHILIISNELHHIRTQGAPVIRRSLSPQKSQSKLSHNWACDQTLWTTFLIILQKDCLY